MPPYEAPDELRITRIYDAPVAAVWDAWTIDDRVRQWWGPRGFSVTTHDKALHPGGSWTYTMHGPDGTDWPNFTRYHEVVPHERLVYDHGATAADARPLFRVTATFTDLGARTELDLRMRLESAEAAARTRAFVKSAGGDATWDRLAEFLEKTTAQTDVFVIARSFATDIETLFDLWTTPAAFERWLPPTGMTMRFHRVDIRPGGDAFYSMGNDDVTMHGRIAYTHIDRPHRLQYTQSFTDAEERLSRAPMMPAWPAYMHATVQFAEEGPSRTRVSVRWQPDVSTTDEELAVFVASRAGVTLGWTGSFDKLDAMIRDGVGA